ncbi:DUF4262 domain-containing protein [Sinorhizobium fredii]|uniref:DUF4262 domain-containing protein n=1 Tax=Rhizobium fredii TaxID=380 RepID=UPI00309F94DF
MYKKVFSKISSDIERCGRSVIGVFGDETGFVYTIGNYLAGLPELLIVAPIHLEQLGGLVNYASDSLLNKGPNEIADGSLIDIGGKYPMKVRQVGVFAKNTFAVQASLYLKTDAYALVQLLLPDTQGRYPGDPDCEDPFRQQPLVLQV